jgi:hypothetical protein
MKDQTSYDYLYDAVQDFNYRTHYMTGTQVIPVVQGTASYALNPDYLAIALTDDRNRPYIKHTYNLSDSFIFNREYANVVIENNPTPSVIAEAFSIIDNTPINTGSLASIGTTGTATANGSAAHGECLLTDSNTDLSNVYPGDNITNTTDGSSGIVVALGTSHTIYTSLFDGTTNQWATNDAYIISPQPRYNLVLSPMPDATATVTVPYIKKPNPVYSELRSYALPSDFMLPIVKFAAFLYKYKDREPNFGDAFFKYYDAFTRKKAAETRRGLPDRQSFRVNFSKSNARSRTFGGWS